MKRRVLWVVAVLALGIAVVLGLGATRPAGYHVERNTKIAAPRERVFAIVSDLHRYGEWQPWARLDPSSKVEVTDGPEPGRGAHYGWSGNDDVGSGTLDVTGIVPNERVDADLTFLRPYPSRSKVAWIVSGGPNETTVSWTMDGNDEGLMAKTMSLFLDIDKMLGKDFAIGLDRLKHVAEAP